MTNDNWNNAEEPANKQVLDEEGNVDKARKNQILKARERVDETEQELFIGVATDPQIRMDIDQQTHAWGMIVKQYIRSILPLLKSDEIEQSEYYLYDVPLLEEEIPPPDTEEYAWSAFGRPDVDPTELAVNMGFGPSFEPPKPKKISVTGLRDVLDRDEIRLYWNFALNPDAIPPQREPVNLKREMALPKPVYESAVEHADEFLQQAGVGLEIGSGDLDDDQLAPDY